MNNTSFRVLMIHTNPCIRVLKEVKALYKKGIYIDVLCKELSLTPELKKYANFIYRWTTFESLQKFLEKNYQQWDIIHCHNEPNDFIALTIDICRNRPVIYDCHDFSSARNPHLPQNELLIEKFCFTQSDAVIHVSDGMKSLAFKKYGPNLSIVLPSLPAQDDIVFTRKPKLQEGNHIVYQGSITGNNDHFYSYRYYLPLFQKICTAGIHVHIFPPRSTTWKVLPEYTEFANTTPYMHLYQHLPYQSLLKTISQYQWGFSGFNFDSIPDEGKPFLNNAFPNKLFDYLYAGVCPIVINNETSAAFVEKNHIGYRAKDIQQVIDICKQKTPLPPIKDISIIDMDQQIEKLINIYKICKNSYESSSIETLYSSSTFPLKDPQAIPVLSVHTENGCDGLRELLLQYYTSGIWLYKEPNIYFSHTSADSHAFYLLSLCSLYIKTNNQKILIQINAIANLLLHLNNINKSGHSGWGLGAKHTNKVSEKKGAISPAETTFTYTSSIVARALLATYKITNETKYLEQCTAWKQTFWNYIGLHPENGCCRYADHESYMDISSFVPNATPLFMGFLAEYIKVTNSQEDKDVLAQLCRNFMMLEQNGNWHYRTGKGEDLLHLAMIAEGLYLTNKILGPVANTSKIIGNMMHMMFSGTNVKTTPVCLGTCNWGPAWALSVFLQYNIPQKYILSGIHFLKKHLNLMLFNIRSASIYMKFFSEL